ncbi:MAG: GNAT family N-acetyltransferase, partial [Bacteroidota bacterium]
MEVSTDKDRLDRQMIYQFLHHEAYWSKGRSWAAVQSSIEHSLCFGVYENGKQIGFARVVSDYTIFGWLLDVFVVPSHRGQGVGKQLLQYIFDYPLLRAVKNWGLKT